MQIDGQEREGAQPGTAKSAGRIRRPDFALGEWPLALLILGGGLLFGFLAPAPVDLLGLSEALLRFDLVAGWLAFALTLPIIRSAGRSERLLVGSLAAFGAIVLVSGLLAGVPLQASALSFALFGVTLAAVASVVLSDPGERVVGGGLNFLVGLGILLVVVSVIEWPFSSHPDDVVGTFLGLGLGARLNGAIAALLAIWFLGRARSWRQVLPAVPFLVVLLLSDAKQPAILVPLALAFSPAIDLRVWFMRLVAPVALAVLMVLAPPIPQVIPENNSYVVPAVADTVGVGSNPARGSRRVRGIEEVSDRLTASPSNLLFGLGPGQSVDYVALLSNTMAGQTLGERLGIDPSQVIEELGPSRVTGSFKSEYSSAVGLIGDYGLLGTTAFLIGLVAIGLMIRRLPVRDRGAAQASALYFLAMGVLYIWWQQPVFCLFTGMLIGLTLLARPVNLDSGGGRQASADGPGTTLVEGETA